jgi:hypothetical protein
MVVGAESGVNKETGELEMRIPGRKPNELTTVKSMKLKLEE